MRRPRQAADVDDGPKRSGTGRCLRRWLIGRSTLARKLWGPAALRRKRSGGAGRIVPSFVVAIAIVACGTRPDGSGPDPVLSGFTAGEASTGRVLENSTACTVDAVCYLRIEFADTTIEALYGTGERPAPPCTISVDVSDAAFEVVVGNVVDVVVSPCADEGHFLERVLAIAH